MKQMSLSELLPDEGCKELMEALNRDYATEQDFHQGMLDVLNKYKDTLQEKGVDAEYLAYAIEAQVMKQAAAARRPAYKVGMRVRVHDGSGENLLGEGTYEGNVKVYFFQMPDGNLQSLQNAEEEPSPEMIPEGAELICTDDNPKIRLDSGEVVYGCQVWWSPIEEEHEHGDGCGCGHDH